MKTYHQQYRCHWQQYVKHKFNTHQQTAECLAIEYLEFMLVEVNVQPVQTIASNTGVHNNSMFIYVYQMKYIWHPQANNCLTAMEFKIMLIGDNFQLFKPYHYQYKCR